jgi:hypothetical protein
MAFIRPLLSIRSGAMYCSNILQLARTREKPLPTMTDEIEARAIAANVAKLPEFCAAFRRPGLSKNSKPVLSSRTAPDKNWPSLL